MRPATNHHLAAPRHSLTIILTVLALLLSPAHRNRSAAASDLEVCSSCQFTSLAEAIDLAEPGAEIVVRGGEYPGGLVIGKSLTLTGIDHPVIDGGNSGTLVFAKDVDLTMSGFTLRRTGSVHDKEDSAIVVEGGRATILDNTIEDALFGVYLKDAQGSTIRGNVIQGKDVDIAMRGDGIKVWFSDDVTIEGNQASSGRDVILWYSNRGIVRNNVLDHERYGLHLMFSNDALIEGNSMRANSIGLFIMYSKNIRVVGNSLSDNHGPSGGGIGLKDVDNITVEGNRFVNNQVGAQIDTSPTSNGIENYWRDNVFAFNQTAIGIMPSVQHNTLTGNSFVDNSEHVATLGRGQLHGITWSENGIGNYWSDYAGFDADGDGIGDIPYRAERLFESLMDDNPELKLFLFSPSAMAIDFAAKAFPGVRPETKLEDPSPLITPSVSPFLPAPEQLSGGSRLVVGGFGLVSAAGAFALIGRLRPKRGTNARRRSATMSGAVL